MIPRRSPLLLAALPAIALAAPGAPRFLAPAARAPLCSGEYADDLAVVGSHARDLERDPMKQYSYCLRTTATYECLSYASDGTVRRARKSVVGHGTGFAYRRSGADTLVLTNAHVASWPAVTDEEHPVDDVPAGCKLVSESVRIVDDEHDAYEANDVVLTRVVEEPALDVAILKTRTPLTIIPWRIGRSAALRAGNAVAARGFPLGAFQAVNAGKVVNAWDHDTARDWDHDDFVVDALLSPGNSGSPVLAVSCRTGEYELVGVYHAGYAGGPALNVVIGVDQLRDLMANLRRAPRVGDPAADLSARDRDALAAVVGSETQAFFPFGNLVAVARKPPGEGEDAGALLLEVYSRGFPLRDDRLLVLQDLPDGAAFGRVGALYLGNRRGLRAVHPSELDADAQAQLHRIVARLRAGELAAVRFRAVDGSTREGVKKLQSMERVRDRQAATDRDAAQALGDLADRLGPKEGDSVTPYGVAASGSGIRAPATASANPR